MDSENKNIPDEFIKVIRDFVSDISNTFPEYVPLINKWWKSKDQLNHIEDEAEREEVFKKTEEKNIKKLFSFCQKKYPPRFFDILYQNTDIFNEDSDVDTEFLPTIFFKNLWNFDISDKTRETIWKYLQLILFSIVSTVDNKEAFGDSAKLFEAINEEDFKKKLEETLEGMQNLFDMSASDFTGNFTNFENLGSNLNMEDMPNANDLHEHISGMLDGKLGKLAKEIAEETAADLNMDMDNVTDMKDVFNKLIKNPTKLMSLVKNVGNKLESRIKSGEIKESELIAEASELMGKMKNMPGMENIQSMLGKMGMPNMGKGTKLNTGAMQAQMDRNMKTAQMKERMRAKAEASRLAKEQQQQQESSINHIESTTMSKVNEEELIKMFSVGEKPEKTPRSAKPGDSQSTKAKKKKSKK